MMPQRSIEQRGAAAVAGTGCTQWLCWVTRSEMKYMQSTHSISGNKKKASYVLVVTHHSVRVPVLHIGLEIECSELTSANLLMRAVIDAVWQHDHSVLPNSADIPASSMSGTASDSIAVSLPSTSVRRATALGSGPAKSPLPPSYTSRDDASELKAFKTSS